MESDLQQVVASMSELLFRIISACGIATLVLSGCFFYLITSFPGCNSHILFCLRCGRLPPGISPVNLVTWIDRDARWIVTNSVSLWRPDGILWSWFWRQGFSRLEWLDLIFRRWVYTDLWVPKQTFQICLKGYIAQWRMVWSVPKVWDKVFLLCEVGNSLKSSLLVTWARFGSLSFALDMCIWYRRAVQTWSTFFRVGMSYDDIWCNYTYIRYKLYVYHNLHNRHNKNYSNIWGCQLDMNSIEFPSM